MDNKEEGVGGCPCFPTNADSRPFFVRWTKKGGALKRGSSHHCLLARRIIAIPRATSLSYGIITEARRTLTCPRAQRVPEPCFCPRVHGLPSS
jgi:hypothetical protein